MSDPKHGVCIYIYKGQAGQLRYQQKASKISSWGALNSKL